jgi:predicted alpha/beta hydrolase
MREPVAIEPFEVVCHDGWRLRGDLLLPPSPRAVAIAGHAMMVDRRTLDRPRGEGLVSRMARAGIAVVWPDLRGHGKSGPRAHEGGDWSYDDLVEGDTPALLAFARARLPGLRLFAVGHSLFGHVTLAHLARHPEVELDGLVMLACNVCNPTWRERPIKYLEKVALIEAMRATTLLFGRLPVRRFNVGTDDESRSYVRDFTRWSVRADWLGADGFRYYAALPRVRTPVLALVGAGDRRMSPPDDVRGLLRPLPHAEIEVVGRATGLAFDPGHMPLVLDPRAQPVWDRAIAWILAAALRSSAPASPARGT